MKKNKYIVADIIFLLFTFGILYFKKEYIMDVLKQNYNAIYLAVGISAIFIVLYIIRCLFRPTYEDITSLKQKGWRITGYYSKHSLEDENVYRKSYSRWVILSLLFLVVEFGIMLIYFAVRGKITVMELYFHVGLVISLQILSWIITLLREKKNDEG